jgi:hypothetical protein
MCQERLGEFESSLVRLTAMNARLDREIELNTRYKESVRLRKQSQHLTYGVADLENLSSPPC